MKAERIAIAQSAAGWLFDAEGPYLWSLALECEGPFLEVGSYCGKSTVWLGDAAEQCRTVLFAVDHHQGSPEMAHGQDCYNPDVMDAEDGAHDTLPLFRRTMRSAGLADIIVPVVGATAVLAPYWSIPVGFVFIDAAHDYEGCLLDAKTWTPWLRPGGLVAFHDTTIPGIASVVNWLVDKGYAELPICETVRVLQKP